MFKSALGIGLLIASLAMHAPSYAAAAKYPVCPVSVKTLWNNRSLVPFEQTLAALPEKACVINFNGTGAYICKKNKGCSRFFYDCPSCNNFSE